MHMSVKLFVDRAPQAAFKGKILEVGSLDINGGVRNIVKGRKPESFIGTDFMDGPGVDAVVDAVDLVKTYGENSFDTVISTEMLEHAEHWRECVTNMKRVCKDWLIITTRSPGFGHHEYPNDFWRYTPVDFQEIFADFDILRLEDDPQAPGVFMVARKSDRPEPDLSQIELMKAPPA